MRTFIFKLNKTIHSRIVITYLDRRLGIDPVPPMGGGKSGDMNLVGYIQENRNPLVWLQKSAGFGNGSHFPRWPTSVFDRDCDAQVNSHNSHIFYHGYVSR